MFRNAYDPRNDTVAQLSPDLPVGSFVHLLNGSLFASGAQRFSGNTLVLGSGSTLGSRGLVIPSTATYYNVGAVSDWFATSFQNGVPITMVVRCSVAANIIGTDNAAAVCGNSLASVDKGFSLLYEDRVSVSSPNRFRMIVSNGSIIILSATFGIAPVKGATYNIVVKFDNSDGNNRVYFYLNGVYYSYGGYTGALATGNASRVTQVGKSNYSSTILPFLGVIDCIAFLPKAMNHQWCLRTSLDPYPSLLRGRMARRWVQSAGGAATINASQGSWSWAGVRAPLSTQIAAAQGAWSWAGPSAKLSTQIPAVAGAWSWTGQAAKLSAQVGATVGAWSWAGTSAKLSRQLNAVAGAWTWAGQSAALQTQVAGVPGTWTWAGQAAALIVSGTVNATAGSWTWAGTAASLAHQVTSTAGVWTWAGAAATVFTTPQLNATVGGWSWVGQATTFSSMVAAAPGTYSWSGVSASVPPPPAPSGPPVKMLFSMAERRGRGRVVSETAPGSTSTRRGRFRTEGS